MVTWRQAIGHGFGRIKGFVAPTAGALLATTAASVGGLLEGQAFYKLILEAGSLGVVVFLMVFILKRFSTLFTEELGANRKQHADEAEASRKQHAEEAEAERIRHSEELRVMHERFDALHERSAERERVLLEQVAGPMREMTTAVRELLSEIRADRALRPTENS